MKSGMPLFTSLIPVKPKGTVNLGFIIAYIVR